MAEYQLTETSMVLRKADNTFIPDAPGNRDWDEYQAWLAAGGVPDPALVSMPTQEYDWGQRFVETLGPPH